MAARPRVGVLVPAGNPTVEPELYRMAPASVTLHFARLESVVSRGGIGGVAPLISYEGELGTADGMERRLRGYLDSLPAATRAIAAVKPAVVLMAHTAVSYLHGFDRETELLDRIGKLTGAEPLTAATAILTALAHLGARRVAMGTPYPEVVGEAGRVFWKAAGLDVVAHRRLDGVANIYTETEDRAFALGRLANVPEAEAIVISGTGLATAGIVERLEREIGKPVVTSQAAGLWRALRIVGISEPVCGYGRLLAGG
ncbi:MAG: hypothetical protein HY216_15565 [Candidatus Rokubacteria bacterium]|nr:hypothetical protein [Candidatus Rokubacteria bacterium]